MKLYFEGAVTLGDDVRYADEGQEGAVWIGGRDLLDEVQGAKWSGPVTVAIGDERFSGDLAVDMGWGYSEYTPMESDSLTVGPHNILAILSEYEGKFVRVWIADEPINTLEQAPDAD